MPLPVLHKRFAQAAVKMVTAPTGPVAALSERPVGSNSTAGERWCTSRSPDVSLRGAKRRGNLGKALPIYTECRRTRSLPNLTVAALSERHGGLQYAPHCLYGARLSDLSLRGAKRRGNLAEPDRTTGKSSAKSQLPSRDCHVGRWPPRNDKSEAFAILTVACTDRKCVAGSGMPLPYNGVCDQRECLPEIATAPSGPRNDKSEAFAILTVACTDCKCVAGRGKPLPYNASSMPRPCEITCVHPASAG